MLFIHLHPACMYMEHCRATRYARMQHPHHHRISPRISLSPPLPLFPTFALTRKLHALRPSLSSSTHNPGFFFPRVCLLPRILLVRSLVQKPALAIQPVTRPNTLLTRPDSAILAPTLLQCRTSPCQSHSCCSARRDLNCAGLLI